MKKNVFRKITIIGIGLIGGSIALGLKGRLGPKISIQGLSSNPERTKLTQKQGVIDQAITTFDQISKDTELIIIATPIEMIIQTLKKISESYSRLHGNDSDHLIIDVGSTKEKICQIAEQILPANYSFIGTHPMAGRELSGFENADPNLFMNKPWIVCPTKRTKRGQLEIVKQLIKFLGGKINIMDPSKHDELISWASHIFLVTSSLLVNLIHQQPKWREIANIASTGFRDTTRLASHDAQMKTDIVLSNKETVISSLQQTKREIDDLIDLISNNNSERVFAYFQQAKEIRDHWLEKFFS